MIWGSVLATWCKIRKVILHSGEKYGRQWCQSSRCTVSDSTVPTLPQCEKLEFGFGLLTYFRCNHNQLPGCGGVMSKWFVPMIENLRCHNNMHWGNKDLCHCSIDVCWPHYIVPSKIKCNLNSRCQLTGVDWGIPNTKLKYCQCAPLCYQSKQIFYCV